MASSGDPRGRECPPPTPRPSRPPTDMGTLEITRGRQALELRSNLSERRALTDPIRAPGRDETSARNLQWAKAHGEHRGHRTQRWHLRGRPRDVGRGGRQQIQCPAGFSGAAPPVLGFALGLPRESPLWW